MYRCITTICGLVFDIDSFEDSEIDEIHMLFQKYKVMFMTSSDDKVIKLEEYYSSDQIYKMEEFQKFFAPNHVTHAAAIGKLRVKATELIYISKRISFIRNANGFLGGTVWITDSIEYENASTASDLICRNLSTLSTYLDKDVQGFLGEIAVFPHEGKRIGTIIPIEFQSDQGKYSLLMLGRYFSYTQYMSQLHPYSSAIYWNKKEGGKAYGAYNGTFQVLIMKAIEMVRAKYHIDGICAVPARPGHKDRFADILTSISSETGIANYGPSLVCVKDYPSQKEFSAQERKENIKGVFSFKKRLNNETIIIIDDVVTTGSTMNECISVLKEAGAGDIYIIVLAVNQFGIEYWSSNTMQVSCPKCGRRMRLFINSYNGSFFYSCSICRNTSLNFKDGRKKLEDSVNLEFVTDNQEFY